MKKLVNDVCVVVPDMLDGLAALNPSLSLLQGSTIVVRADADAVAACGEVALISGGGSATACSARRWRAKCSRRRPQMPCSMRYARWPARPVCC